MWRQRALDGRLNVDLGLDRSENGHNSRARICMKSVRIAFPEQGVNIFDMTIM